MVVEFFGSEPGNRSKNAFLGKMPSKSDGQQRSWIGLGEDDSGPELGAEHDGGRISALG